VYFFKNVKKWHKEHNNCHCPFYILRYNIDNKEKVESREIKVKRKGEKEKGYQNIGGPGTGISGEQEITDHEN
jgi:hypothetical protein